MSKVKRVKSFPAKKLVATKPQKSEKQKTLEIILVVDCSGSMAILAQEASRGINNFIKEQQEVTDTKAKLSLIEFDTFVDVKYLNLDIMSVSEYRLIPKSLTAMNDGIGKAIDKESVADHVIVMIVTDGRENASKNYSHSDIKGLIQRKKELGWDFIFLSAEVDAEKTGHSYGVSASAKYGKESMNEIYAMTSDKIKLVRSQMLTGIHEKMMFTNSEKNKLDQ